MSMARSLPVNTFEIGADAVAQGEPFPFQLAAEGGVLRAQALFDAEQAFVGGQVIDLAAGREHCPQLEGDELRSVASERGVGGNELSGGQAGQPEGLEDGRDAAEALNLVELTIVGVQGECVPGRGGHQCPGGEQQPGDGIPRAAEHLQTSLLINEIAVAGIHVDGGDQPGCGGAGHVSAETVPINGAVGAEGQERSGVAGDFAAGDEVHQYSSKHR